MKSNRKPNNVVARIIRFYAEGFKEMSSWAKALWLIILIKLFVMFMIFKLFFFRDTLKNKFDTTEERAHHVIEQLTQ